MPFIDTTQRREYQRNWIANRRTAFFAGRSCTECGSVQDLELDHIDPAEKVSHRIWSWSAERRDEELAKCQILCTECHLEKSVKEASTAKHGDPSKYRSGCRCAECREAQRIKMSNYRLLAA